MEVVAIAAVVVVAVTVALTMAVAVAVVVAVQVVNAVEVVEEGRPAVSQRLFGLYAPRSGTAGSRLDSREGGLQRPGILCGPLRRSPSTSCILRKAVANKIAAGKSHSR